LKLNFKQWLDANEMAGTGAVFDSKAKGTFNWWGAPGSTGKVIDGDVPVHKDKKHKKKK